MRCTFLLFIFLLIFAAQSRAATPNRALPYPIFAADSIWHDAMLDSLEAYILAHPEVSAAEILQQHPTWKVNTAVSLAPPFDNLSRENVMYFLAGCLPNILLPGLGGVVGIMITYYMSDMDRNAAKWALAGCLSYLAIFILAYAIIIALSFSGFIL